ncbi:hypothetical protein DPMN_135808 [Dreissena polymorpha]|uniref:Uncharacterized protein n=1 Tax=Dreissena polymorpha TaxID=45954 RepID=A0A9D4JG47_DREPO|nr:hypothetical protein DPMN_135808 [Dreissena polymorpha]
MAETLVGPQEPLHAAVKQRKLALFGHVSRHDSLFNTHLQTTLDEGRAEEKLNGLC